MIAGHHWSATNIKSAITTPNTTEKETTGIMSTTLTRRQRKKVYAFDGEQLPEYELHGREYCRGMYWGVPCVRHGTVYPRWWDRVTGAYLIGGTILAALAVLSLVVWLALYRG